jgi:predicted transcriptional regulator
MISNTGMNSSVVFGVEVFDQKLYSATTSGLYVTPDGDEDWEIIPEFENKEILSISKKDDMIFVGTLKGIYGKNQNSSEWNTYNEGLISLGVIDIKTGNNKLYIATDHGVLFSQNLNKPWKLLPNSHISPYLLFPKLGVGKTYY